MGTINIQLDPHQLADYIRDLNQQGEPFHFTVGPHNSLRLVIDGKEDDLEIHLHGDGTFTVSHVLKVGVEP